MIAKIIPVGNSKGIRIPNYILKQLNIQTKLEMIVDEKHDEVVLKPIKKIRDGWDSSFQKMRKNNEDTLLIDDSVDLKDWEW